MSSSSSASTPASASAVIQVTCHYGSHGVSVYGEYWERWRGSVERSISEETFKEIATNNAALFESDCQEMRRGDQRSMFQVEISRPSPVPHRY